MLRSLPSISRIISAIFLTVVITGIIYKSFLPRRHVRISVPEGHLAHCNDNGYCDIIPQQEDLLKSPSRQEFTNLELRIKHLNEEIEKLKHPEPIKEPTPEEILWETRRSECGEGVVRNIDYQHVLSPCERVNSRV
jgi:hypothetical protein